VKKGLMSLVLLLACTQLFLASGAGHAAAAWLEEAIVSGRLISAALRYEHNVEPIISPMPEPEPIYTAAPVVVDRPVSTPLPSSSPEVSAAPDYSKLELDNDSSYTIDPEALMSAGFDLSLPKEGPQILIMRTHGTESYTMESGWEYAESDYARTTDNNYNMIRVGDALAEAFEAYGLTVLHDTALHDYPSYTGSYTRSAEAVEKHLAEHPDIAIVIDLHRDAIGDGETTYKTEAHLPGKKSAQIMLLAGTGENGLSHPNWQENLKLALFLQERAAAQYPGLMRPVNICKERYNQQLTTGSIIIEVGSNGNTLAEALTAVELFAEAVSPALLERVK